MTDFSAARTMMVDTQIRTEGVTDHAIIRAMGEVPRERFVPARARPFAYSDADIVIQEGHGHERRMMRPATLARLIQAAAVTPTDVVLDIGCGSGYSVALLAALASSVVGLESDEALAAQASNTLVELGVGNVAIVTGPLEDGYPSEAPYDVIFIDGAVEAVPEKLFNQLREGGRLAAVVGYSRAASAMIYTRTDREIGARPAFDAYAPPLPGFRKPAGFVF